MSIRHVHRTAAKLLTATAIAAVALAASASVAGATGPASGTIVPGSDVPVGTFTAGAPYSSGQGINVVVPANSIFSSNTNLNIVECAAPGGVPPTDPSNCDGNTIQGPTIKPATDGSLNYQTATHGGTYTVYALPDPNLSESPSGLPVCNLTNECVLYIGDDQTDFTQPHYWSEPFFVNPSIASDDSQPDLGANPGDGSAPADLVSLAANPGTALIGQSVALTATVTSNVSGCTPSGNVSFVNGTTPLGTAPISGGTATLNTSTLPSGENEIGATFSGSTGCPGVFSAATDVVVGKANTTTTITAAPTSSVFGQSVTFTATVAPVAPATGTPTGVVTFSNGTTTLGTGTLSGGTATLTTSTLAVGSASISASYPGDTSFKSSASGTTTYVVGKASTTTGLTASPTAGTVFGQSVTLTAAVAPVTPGAGTPSGTVTFKDGATTLGTGTVSGGTASFTTSALAVASHSLTASYGGDGNFSTSSSSTVTYAVSKASTTTTLSAAPVSPSVSGQSVTFTATVAPVAPGAGAPSGTVTFTSGTTTLGTATISGGKASISTSTLAVGSYSVVATYGGDSSFGGSAAAPFAYTVNKASTTSSLASSGSSSAPGQSVTFTDTVAAVAPAAGTPTGTVTFKDGATTLGTGTLSGGKATFTTTTLAIGTHSITAAYGGDGAFNGSTSGTVSQTVLKLVTVLTGQSQISLNPLAIILPSVKATLTSGGNGVAGQLITFTAGSTTVCTAVTNAAGVAQCTPPLADEVDIILALGVHESYAGNATYDPSSASTSIIEV